MIQQLAADARPVRLVRPVGARLGRWAGSSVLFLTVALLVLRVRPDLSTLLAHPIYVATILAIGVSGALAAGAALVLSVPGRERRVYRVAPLAAALTWPVLLLASAGSPPAAAVPPAVCATLIVGLAAAPAWLLRRYEREGATCAPAWAAALIMLASGCGAALVLQLHCQSSDMTHVLFEHVLAVAVLAVGGAVASAWAGSRQA